LNNFKRLNYKNHFSKSLKKSIMKNMLFFFILLFSSNYCNAQFFQATIESDGNDLIFKIRPNLSGGDITTTWSDMEFFVRWPDGESPFNFGAITVNTTDFPGVSIPNNGSNAQGAETGYTNNWFGTSFSVSPTATYLDGTEYEVFRVALDLPAESISFELVHNNVFSPHYLSLISGSGFDLTNPSGLMFYGPTAQICSPNCPASTPGSNHVDGGSLPLPVELMSFSAQPINNEKVLLAWRTASETNNDFFSVEHSTDGIRFIEIDRILGAGTFHGILDYKTFDEEPSFGNNYYRLKQVDFDGSEEYSEIQSVSFAKEDEDVKLYPNPTYGTVNIRWPGSENYQVMVYNANGEFVFSENNSKRLELSGLPQGIYQLRFLDVDRQKESIQRIVLVD
jgi:type IX secretion system substrate protein